METVAQPWPCSSHGNKIDFCGFYFEERQLQWSWGSVGIPPSAQHSWKGSADTKIVPSHFLINASLFTAELLYLLRSMGFHIRGQILFWFTLSSFLGRISPRWEAPDSWVSSSKQAAPISGRMEHQTTALPRNQLLSTSAAHFCVTGVSAFGQEYLGPKAAHCQIQQSCGFYLQCHYFPFLLCLHSELSYFGAEPASFSDYIWIYSHRLSLYFEGKLDQICSFLLLLVLV